MARTNTLTNFLTDVATAIRTKSGTTGTIAASAFDTKIGELTNYKVDVVTDNVSSNVVEFEVLGEPKAYALICTNAATQITYNSSTNSYITSARYWDGTTCKTIVTRLRYTSATSLNLSATTSTTTTSSEIGTYNSSTNKFTITGITYSGLQSSPTFQYTLIYIY